MPASEASEDQSDGAVTTEASSDEFEQNLGSVTTDESTMTTKGVSDEETVYSPVETTKPAEVTKPADTTIQEETIKPEETTPPTETSKTVETTSKPVETTIPADTVDDVQDVVYTTATGKRYHSRKTCTGLNNANKIYESTLENAKKAGLTACSKCY